MQPQRRSYSKSFKVQVIQECAQPGASIASVALSHSLNANLVHKWIRVQTQKYTQLQPAFIPLPMPLAGANSQAASSNIRVEIEHPRGTVKVNWPTESAAGSSSTLRGEQGWISHNGWWSLFDPKRPFAKDSRWPSSGRKLNDHTQRYKWCTKNSGPERCSLFHRMKSPRKLFKFAIM